MDRISNICNLSRRLPPLFQTGVSSWPNSRGRVEKLFLSQEKMKTNKENCRQEGLVFPRIFIRAIQSRAFSPAPSGKEGTENIYSRLVTRLRATINPTSTLCHRAPANLSISMSTRAVEMFILQPAEWTISSFSARSWAICQITLVCPKHFPKLHGVSSTNPARRVPRPRH